MSNVNIFIMKKAFTQKLSYIALGLLLFSPQLRAEDVKVDYTDYLQNPSFEHYNDVDKTPLDVTITSDKIVGSALRGTPPGWSDTGVTPPATGNLSYGINRNAVGKDGFNASWCAPTPFPNPFALYQEVQSLPAGQYIISCRMWVSSERITNQRFFVQTKNGENITNNIVQYYASENFYGLNVTEGETNTFAGWEMTTGVGDGDSRLKPMSILVTVAEGETLVVGVRSGNQKWQPSTSEIITTTNNSGFYKVDDFRITKVIEDPSDFTSRLVNPSFEQILVDEVPTQLKTYNIAAYSALDPQRGVPYGWTDIIDDSLNPVPNNDMGQSYGVNTDANGYVGAKHMWAMRTPFVSSYTLYQDVTGLPAGKYEVSCSMFVEDGKIATQRLFANNQVQYYGTEYDYLNNLTDGEVNSFAGWTTSSSSAFSNGMFLRKLSVEVDVHADATLRLGIKSGNIKSDGTVGISTEGWFKADNFKLRRIGDVTGIKTIENTYFTVNGQKGGFWLNMGKTIPAQVKVFTISGQVVYNSQVNNAKSWISLPQGLYIVNMSVDGVTKAEKVLVR